MRHVTIVGGGQAGLVLAVGLLDAGFKVRLAQNRTAHDIATGKVLSSQCVFANGAREERRLGLDLWDEAAPAIAGVRVAVAAPDGSGQGVRLRRQARRARAGGRPARSSSPASWRSSRERGGTIEIAEVGVPELERYAADSDLVVVAAGQGPVSQLFERDAARSPYDAADARAFAGLRKRRDAARGDLRDRQHHSGRRRAVHDSGARPIRARARSCSSRPSRADRSTCSTQSSRPTPSSTGSRR